MTSGIGLQLYATLWLLSQLFVWHIPLMFPCVNIAFALRKRGRTDAGACCIAEPGQDSTVCFDFTASVNVRGKLSNAFSHRRVNLYAKIGVY